MVKNSFRLKLKSGKKWKNWQIICHKAVQGVGLALFVDRHVFVEDLTFISWSWGFGGASVEKGTSCGDSDQLAWLFCDLSVFDYGKWEIQANPLALCNFVFADLWCRLQIRRGWLINDEFVEIFHMESNSIECMIRYLLQITNMKSSRVNVFICWSCGILNTYFRNTLTKSPDSTNILYPPKWVPKSPIRFSTQVVNFT